MKRFRFFGVILTVLLIVSCAIPASSQDSEAEITVPGYETELLSALGIEIDFSAPEVTRGDFAVKLATVAGGYVTIAEQREMIFSDVTLTQADSASISAVYRSGLMNGVGDGKFAPKSGISSQDAVVALVRLCGYEIMAKVHGGYPAGYIYAADYAGITDGVSTGSEPLTPHTLSTLIYNTLNTDVYQLISLGDGEEYAARKGENVLAIYHKIYKAEGRITANRFTSLVSDVSPCPNDCIELDGVLYNYISQDMENKLGLTVEAYYKKYSSDKKGNIISMYAKPDVNEVVTVMSEDINSVNGNTAEIFVGEKTKKLNVIKGFNLIYNGKCDPAGTMADLLTDGCEFTFINSDGNSGYETIIMQHKITLIVTGTDRTDYVIYGKNQNTVSYGGSLTSGGFDLRDSNGEKVYIDNLKNGDVLSVFASKDNECIRMILSTDTVSGEVVSIDAVNHTVTLRYRSEDTTYNVVPEYLSDFTLGLKGDFYLDTFSNLVYTNAEPGDSFEYGYFMNIDFSGGLNPVCVKIYTPMGFEVFECVENLIIDGNKTQISASANNPLVSGNTAIPQVVRYKCDKNDKLRFIDTVAVGSGDAESDRLSFSKTVSGVYNIKFANLTNGCALGGDTFFVKIPETLDPYDEDNYDSSLEMLTEGQIYEVDTYDMDEGLVPKVVIYKADDRSVGGALDEYSPCGIVSEVNVNCLDKDGNARTGIRVFDTKSTSDKEITLYFDPEFPVAQTMKFGDVINYRADKDNVIMQWKYDYNFYNNSFTANAPKAYFTRYVGYPYAKNDGSFSFLNTANNAELNESWDNLLVFPTSVMTFIEVDMATREITHSDYKYVDSFMHSKNTDDLGYVMVYRGGGHYLDRLIVYKNVSKAQRGE